MRWMLLLAFVVSLSMFVPAVAHADVWGLGPTLVGAEKTTLTPTAQKLPVSSNIVGLEGYSLWGTSAGAAAAVNWKRTVGTAKVKGHQLDFRVGVLAGVVSEGSTVDSLFGAFGEVEAAKIGGLVLVLRVDGGKIVVNPGFKLNVVSVSF